MEVSPGEIVPNKELSTTAGQLCIQLTKNSFTPALMRSWMSSMISSTCADSMLVLPARPTSRATNLAQAMDWQITSSSHWSKGSCPKGVVGLTVAQVLAGSQGGGILSSLYWRPP